MKIDFYISSLSGGGAEKVLITIAQAFARQRHEVTIVSLEKRPAFYEVDPQVRVIRFPAKKNGIIGWYQDYRNIHKFLEDSQADVTFSFLLRCNLLLLWANKKGKHKVIVCDRNHPLKEHTRLVFMMQNLLYRRAYKIVVQTKSIKSFYAKYLQSRIEVIENPIDTQALLKQVQKNPKREHVILAMGRLERQKDYKTLMQAFAKICYAYPNWRVKVFGQGNMQKELEEYRNVLGLQGVFSFCGRTDRPFYEMKKANIFVLSSFYEGFPNVLCEAMYAGDLCIASDCVSGPRELILDGENGWLFPIGDVDRLADCLAYCMQQEKVLEMVRKKAQESVERLYLEQNINKWKRVME